jgi:MFS family permease
VTPRGPGQIRAGFRYISTVPELWISFAMLLVIGTLTYNFTVVFPLFVVKGLHGNVTTYTYVYAAFSIGGLLGALLVARRATISIRTVAMGAAALGTAMLVMAGVPNTALAIVMAVPVGAASVAYMTSTTSIAQIGTKPEMRGRVLSLQTVLLMGTTPIGGPLLGAVSDAVGARTPMVIGALGGLAAAAVGLVAARRVSHRAAVQAPVP